MSRAFARAVPGRVVGAVVAVLAVLTATLLVHAQPAGAEDPFGPVGYGPTQGTPVPGAYLQADRGTWTAPPEAYDFEWLRDGTPIPGADTETYLVQAADVAHVLAPRVTGHRGSQTASFTGTATTVRRLASSLTVDVRRVHPAPGRNRLVWVAGGYLSTERPWPTDGGLVTAYKQKGDRRKPLGTAVLSRGAAVVRLPWKRAPRGRTEVQLCFAGTDAVAPGCSAMAVVRSPR